MFLEKKQREKETNMDPKLIGKRLKMLMLEKQVKRSYLAKKKIKWTKGILCNRNKQNKMLFRIR